MAFGIEWLAQVDNSGAGAAVAGMGIIMILFWIIALIGSIFWIWMLIDCLTSSLPTNEKILWCAVIFFLHLLGAILYFFIARGGGRGATTAI